MRRIGPAQTWDVALSSFPSSQSRGILLRICFFGEISLSVQKQVSTGYWTQRLTLSWSWVTRTSTVKNSITPHQSSQTVKWWPVISSGSCRISASSMKSVISLLETSPAFLKSMGSAWGSPFVRMCGMRSRWRTAPRQAPTSLSISTRLPMTSIRPASARRRWSACVRKRPTFRSSTSISWVVRMSWCLMAGLLFALLTVR